MTKPAVPRAPLALIADDSEWSTRSLESILAHNGYSIIRAYTGAQALERAGYARPDLIIIDAELPDTTGIGICRSLRDDPRISASTPILLKTAGRRTRERRLEALAAGAWDFLGLPVDAEELVLRLDSYVRAKFDADSRRESGLIDELTGLYNEQGLVRRAAEMGSDAYRHGRPLGCVAFAPHVEAGAETSFNGDGEGEEARRFARFIGRAFRDAGRISDAIGRRRAAEFAVVAPATDGGGAVKLARRLLASLEKTLVGGEAKRPARVVAGYYGVGDFRTAGLEAEELLERASLALREALEAEPDAEPIRAYAAE